MSLSSWSAGDTGGAPWATAQTDASPNNKTPMIERRGKLREFINNLRQTVHEHYFPPGADCRWNQTVPRFTNGSLPSEISVRRRKLVGDDMNVLPFNLTFLPLKVNGAACQACV